MVPRLAKLISLFALLTPLATAQEITAIKNVTVVDVVNARTLPGCTVLVKGKTISAVGPSSAIQVPGSARVIDGSGKFAIPGLWDMHTHFTADPSSLDLFIANGVTGVRDMGSIAVKRKGKVVEYLPRDEAIRLIIDTRNKVRDGKLLGPTIYTVGMIVTGPSRRNPNGPSAPHQIVVKTPAEARATVRRLKRMGVDFIKVHARLTRESFLAITDEAKRLGLPVVGHVPTDINPIEASRAGMKSIEHLTGEWEYAHEGLPESDQRMKPGRFAAEVAEFRKNHTWQVPTIVNYQAAANGYGIIQDFDAEKPLDYVAPELAMRWMATWPKAEFTLQTVKDFTDSVETIQDMTKRLVQGGVPVMAGTDSGSIFTYPGISLHKELELLNQGGLTTMQTLRSATIRPAQFLGIENKAGSIAKGKVADLVLLNADPLTDIKNTTRIDTVILKGRVLDRAQLDGILQRLRKRAAQTRTILKTYPWTID